MGASDARTEGGGEEDEEEEEEALHLLHLAVARGVFVSFRLRVSFESRAENAFSAY